MKKRLQGLIVGFLIGAILTSGMVSATSGRKTIEVMYNNIKVYKDNVLCELRDANGNVVEPFIYNGTTYMPVRGTANLADMDVTWDGSTQSVYLWDNTLPNETFLLDMCQPYSMTNQTAMYQSSNGESFSMGGKKYSDGITIQYDGGYALFNLDGKYSSIECTVGHTGHEDWEKTVSFILDGKIVKEVRLEAECLPKTISVPLNYGLQLKIMYNENTGPGSAGNWYVGIGNIKVK